jgi:predicted MPP superfamily phosphohydrolase
MEAAPRRDHGTRHTLPSGRARALLLGLGVALLLGALDAFWLEPRVLLFEDPVHVPLVAQRLRLVHLSDLHISGDTPLLHRLLRRIAAARPDLIAVSGDMIKDVQDPRPQARHAAAAAAFFSQLRRAAPRAPIYAVQGHSEYQGQVVVALGRAGLTWLSNEGRRVGPGGGLLLLGLNQQVGIDRLALSGQSPFRIVRAAGESLQMARLGPPVRNFYSHYDPAPRGLGDESGPLAWSGYDAVCDVRIDGESTGAGIEVHSRYVAGEDRMIRLRRMGRKDDGTGTFELLVHGSAFTGAAADRLDTGVDPRPGRWYRLRLRTRVEPGVVRVAARAWQADQPEPERWQAWAEDRSPERVTAGTVGTWAWGRGTVHYRDMRVIDSSGRQLLGPAPSGPRQGTGGGAGEGGGAGNGGGAGGGRGGGSGARGRGTEGVGSDRGAGSDGRVGVAKAFGRGGLARVTAAGAAGWRGWRDEARDTRLELALARSPAAPPGTPWLLLSHTPDAVLEASQRGIEAVLAGHTHGGQVRLPGIGALTTRSSLGPYYDYGLYFFAAPNQRGITSLFINAGVGTSLLPLRFFCPPRFAVVDLGR